MHDSFELRWVLLEKILVHRIASVRVLAAAEDAGGAWQFVAAAAAIGALEMIGRNLKRLMISYTVKGRFYNTTAHKREIEE